MYCFGKSRFYNFILKHKIVLSVIPCSTFIRDEWGQANNVDKTRLFDVNSPEIGKSMVFGVFVPYGGGEACLE